MDTGGWLWVLVAGFGGFGLGIGLVLGAFIARTLRRYMESERMQPYDPGTDAGPGR